MSVDASPRGAATAAIIALERSCLEAEAALMERRWADVDAVFAAQAVLTDELRELFAAAPEFAPANDEAIAQRVRGILAYRADQLRRLRAYHAEVEGRLRSIGKVRALSRSIGKRERAGALYDTQR